ncbi:MAG TPA: hypothetical protein VJ505_10320, partial [Holophagaceae bacterium]|nr:hypothetical protein [Holophagaceae bacterium]
ASGIGYLIGSTATLILPTWSGRVGMLTTLLEMGEPVLVLWLLIVGAKASAAPPQVGTAAEA